MKKLLLTLGTVAAVAAPVASVVACGTKEVSPKEATTATVTKMLSDAGYSMTDQAKEELVTYLLKVSGNDTLSLGHAFKGIQDGDEINKTHGNNDFAVVINGEVKDVSNEGNFVGGSTLHYGTVANNDNGIAEPVVPESQTRSKIQFGKWGYTAPEFKNARFVIFLQNDGTTSTLEVAEIFNFKGVTYELDQPDSMTKFKNSDDETFKTFATHKFAVAKA